jgi:hypothetical protein
VRDALDAVDAVGIQLWFPPCRRDSIASGSVLSGYISGILRCFAITDEGFRDCCVLGAVDVDRQPDVVADAKRLLVDCFDPAGILFVGFADDVQPGRRER